MSEINWKTKCWVTAIYLVKENKVLLSWNKNMQTWIPVGGHINPGENQLEALRREVKEETGCEFELINGIIDYGHAKVLNNAIIQIEKVPHHGEHINTILFGKIIGEPGRETDEKEKLKWFTKEELEKEKEKMILNVYEQALSALTQNKKQNFSLAAKAFIVEKEKVLLIKRRPNDADKPGRWDLPGGRIGSDEDPEEGLKREVKEETGIEIEILAALSTRHFTRDDGQVITGINYLCKTTKPNQKIILSEEHTEYTWEEIKAAKEKAFWGFRKAFETYEKLKSGEMFK
jgi:8-oxo-dGTP diphosphatase